MLDSATEVIARPVAFFRGDVEVMRVKGRSVDEIKLRTVCKKHGRPWIMCQ